LGRSACTAFDSNNDVCENDRWIKGPTLPSLAQFKRHYNYTFSVTNKKTPGAQNFSFEGIELKVLGRSGSTARPSTCRRFPVRRQRQASSRRRSGVQSRNASKLDQKSVSARTRPRIGRTLAPDHEIRPAMWSGLRPDRLSPDPQPVMHIQIVDADRQLTRRYVANGPQCWAMWNRANRKPRCGRN
jgi:hypothetical protein